MSEDQDRSQQEEHWRELAQLLGIGPEPPAAKPAPAKESVAPPPVEAKAPPPPPIEVEEPPPPPEPEPVLPAAESREEVFEAPPAEESWKTRVDEPLYREVTTAQTEDRPIEMDTEEKPRRGRRRKGRRGRREERRPTRVEEEPIDMETPDEEMPFPEDSENGAEEPEDAPEPVEAQTDDEDLDVEATLRDWNVPSWNELIASLYRPDR